MNFPLIVALLAACGRPSCPVTSPSVPAKAQAEACPVAGAGQVVVCPEPSNAAERVPDVGVSTFHQTRDEIKVRYPDAAVAYQRWWWREVEVGPGQYDFSGIDDLLLRAEAADQDVGIRIMPDGSGKVDTPQWLIDKGLKGTYYGGQFSPDYDDPLFLDAADKLTMALGARYDGHPRLAFVDIGMVGQAGEWHVTNGKGKGATLPSRASWERIIDTYLDAFTETPLAMLIGDVDDGGDPVRYATERGAGWRADCLGNNLKGWNHMDDFYLQRVEEANLGDVWMTAPMLFETCGSFPSWKKSGADPACMLDYGLGLHTSGVNAKSDRMPKSFIEHVDAFQSRVGYHLRLTSLSHPAVVLAGEPLDLSSVWLNTGVAPPYRPFRVAWRWAETGAVQLTGTQIRGWLPGSVDVEERIDAPNTAGTYALQLAILGVPGEDIPRVPVGIRGTEADGWTTVTQVVVE